MSFSTTAGFLIFGGDAASVRQPAEFGVGRDVAVLLGVTAAAFILTALLFDPEQRFVGKG